jgi:predicted chitinase
MLDATSGETGSPAENQAHEVAGIIMRNFNKKHPKYFNVSAIHLNEGKWNDFKKEFIRKGKQSLAAATAIGAIGGGFVGYDYAKDKFQNYNPQQQQQLEPDIDNDDGPPIIQKNEIPSAEVPNLPNLEIPDATQPELKLPKVQPPLSPQFLKKYVEAQKIVKLPNPLENSLKNIAIKEGIVGLELDQFLGQYAHESGNFTQFDEMFKSDGTVRHNKKWFIDHYWKNERIRHSLGNKHPDDSWRYRGRGICQLTGRNNYDAAGKALGVNLIEFPALASHPKYIIPISIWYWKTQIVTRVSADHMGDTTVVTRAINHGESKENIQKRHAWVEWFRNIFKKGA